jgi:hypothetical protein
MDKRGRGSSQRSSTTPTWTRLIGAGVVNPGADATGGCADVTGGLTAPTKDVAHATGRGMAIDRGVEHLIHNQDGPIGLRNTHPADVTRERRRADRRLSTSRQRRPPRTAAVLPRGPPGGLHSRQHNDPYGVD